MSSKKQCYLAIAFAFVTACESETSHVDAGQTADTDSDADSESDTGTGEQDYCDLSDLVFPDGFEMYETETSSTITGVWGDSADTVFAVSEYGDLLEFDGISWTTTFGVFDYGIYEIWGYSTTDIYVSGRKVYHFDGESWNEVALEENPGWDRYLVAIWGFAPGEVIVGGYDHDPYIPDDKGPMPDDLLLLLECGETACAEFDPPPTTWLTRVTDIWGPSPENVYITVGYKLWRLDGTSWSQVEEPSHVSTCTSVSGSGQDDVHTACGERAWHFDGSSWSPSNFEPDIYLPKLWVDGVDSAFIAGGVVHDSQNIGGRLESWDGTEWSTITDELPRNPTALYGISGSGLWLGGDCGLLVYYAFE